MTDEEIKKIVKIAIEESEERLMCDEEELKYSYMSIKLKKHYRGRQDERIRNALNEIKSDKYFRIIPYYYKDGKTITAISVNMECDRSTIARNKRRLVLQLYSIYSEKQ